jgi:hypothetical protein
MFEAMGFDENGRELLFCTCKWTPSPTSLLNLDAEFKNDKIVFGTQDIDVVQLSTLSEHLVTIKES